MGSAGRVFGYFASVAIASIFYVAWFVIDSRISIAQKGRGDITFEIALAFFFLIFEGMGATFALMALPWYCAVRLYGRLQRLGLAYFSLIGAAAALLIGSATSSVSPKPLFIEDQTFLEGFKIAVERQGLCLLLTGFTFGLTFWLVSERPRYSRPVENFVAFQPNIPQKD